MASGYSVDSNTDPLWWYEPPQQKFDYPIITTSTNTIGSMASLYEEIRKLQVPPLRDTRNPYTGAKSAPGASQRERAKMGYNDREQDYRSDQEKIDDAVREALAKPRREAEIAKRVALVTVLEPLVAGEVGTVLTFTKKSDRKESVTAYAAYKTGDDQWFVTGDGYRTNGDQRNTKGLLEWMTTGPNLVEDIKRATKFEAVAPASA